MLPASGNTPFCDIIMPQRGALVLSYRGIKRNPIRKEWVSYGIFTFGEDTHTLRLKSELFDLRVGYANPILRHSNAAERGLSSSRTVV